MLQESDATRFLRHTRRGLNVVFSDATDGSMPEEKACWSGNWVMHL